MREFNVAIEAENLAAIRAILADLKQYKSAYMTPTGSLMGDILKVLTNPSSSAESRQEQIALLQANERSRIVREYKARKEQGLDLLPGDQLDYDIFQLEDFNKQLPTPEILIRVFARLQKTWASHILKDIFLFNEPNPAEEYVEEYIGEEVQDPSRVSKKPA